jgi:hypothetical protein
MSVRRIAIDECSDIMAEVEGINSGFDYGFSVHEVLLDIACDDDWAEGIGEVHFGIYGQHSATVARSRLVTGRLEEGGKGLKESADNRTNAEFLQFFNLTLSDVVGTDNTYMRGNF